MPGQPEWRKGKRKLEAKAAEAEKNSPLPDTLAWTKGKRLLGTNQAGNKLGNRWEGVNLNEILTGRVVGGCQVGIKASRLLFCRVRFELKFHCGVRFI